MSGQSLPTLDPSITQCLNGLKAEVKGMARYHGDTLSLRFVLIATALSRPLSRRLALQIKIPQIEIASV
jgi:hypothetical protein